MCLAALGSSGAAGPLAFVTNQSDETLTVVDIADERIVATYPAPGRPAGVALGPDGVVWVTSPESNELRAIDLETGAARVIDIGGGPLGLAVNPVSGAVYVAEWYGDHLDVVENGVVTARAPTGDSPSGIAVTPDGGLILTADRDSSQVSIFKAETRERVAVVPVGERPFGVTVGPNGVRAYTANVGSNDVTVIDIAGARVVAHIPVGERPYAVAFARGLGFVTNSYGDSVSVFDLATHEAVATIDVGEYPEGIDATGAEDRVFVANWMTDTLSVIDVETLDVIADIPVGSGPRAFGDFIAD